MIAFDVDAADVVAEVVVEASAQTQAVAGGVEQAECDVVVVVTLWNREGERASDAFAADCPLDGGNGQGVVVLERQLVRTFGGGIDEMDESTQAFNAFLKTLEEPPAHAIFILATTEKHKILPTILSRCQTYDFNRISVPDIVRNLRDIAGKEGITVDDESLHVIALKADGAMRDALTIFDQTVAFCGTEIRYEEVLRNLNVLDYEHCFQLVDSFLACDYAAALLKLDEILSKGFNALYFVSSLSGHLRDLMVARSGGLDALLELPDSLKVKYKEQAARCPMQFLYDALAITTACEAGYKTAVNPRLHIEFALMRLSFLCGGEVSLRPAAPAQPAAKPVQPVSKPAPVPPPAVKPEAPKPEAPKPAPAQPAPEKPEPPKEKVETAPVRRRGSKVTQAYSLQAVQEKEEAGPAVPAASPDAALPEDGKVQEAWQALVKSYEDRTRLYTVLSGAKTEMAEADGVKVLSFYVVNVAQQGWIKDKILPEMENKMRRSLGSAKFRLEILVTPDEEIKKVNYTQQEQAQALMKDNPEVKNLVTDFGLDI